MPAKTGSGAGSHERFGTRTIPANKWYGGVVTVREDKGGCVAQGGNGAVKTLTLTDRDALLASTCSASGASAKANRPSALPPLAGRLLRMTTVVGSALQGAQARVVQSLLPVVLLVGGVVGLADEVFAQEKPVLTLELTSSSISENGGVSSLTGSLSGALDSDVTVQVETIPRGVAVAADLTQTGTTLTFQAGSTTATGTVEFSAVNDDVYSGDRQFSILTSVSGSVTVPTTSLRLTITDDEAMPTLTVELTPSSIGENGGVSSLTANLSGAARFEVTVEVTAVDPRGSAAAEDVTQSGTTLTFAAGSTTPTGTVQFTAVDNDVYDGGRNREYSVRWSKTGLVQTVGTTTEVLTITDDDEKPVLTLALTPTSIGENGGVSSLTGSLNGTLGSDVTVTVETLPRGVAVAGDLTQTGTTLTFAAGSTTPTETVQFTAVNDEVYSGDRQFSILTSVSGSVTVPTTSLRLTITDDEAMPTLTVELTPSSIGENGGVSSLTANLSGAARFEVTVEVTAVDPRGSAAAEDVTQSGTTLTFAAGSTTPTGTVQFTAVDNEVNDGNREYSIRWRKEGDVQTVGATTEVLTITDDDEKPVLTLELTSSSISENGGVSSLTGSLSGTLDSDVTVQVETIPRGVAVAADLTQTGTTLTFQAGSTTATGTVEFSAVNDDVYSGDRQFSILTSVSGSVTVPTTSLRLTITDDEAMPTLTVELTPSSIGENGGVSSLTANLSGAARFEVTVEVTEVDPRGSAAAEDVTQTGTTLTFAAGSTTPTGTVQFTAVDNEVNDGNREYSIRWRKEGDVQTVGATTEVLTITDDDEKPVLTLELTSSSISENGGVSSLTGSLSGTLDSDVTVQVETIPRGVAVAADLTQTGTTLTFQAGSTTATGTVEFSAVNDDVYSGDRQFSILTSVSGSVTVPTTSLRLTITDDEAMPTLTVELTPSSIGENGGVSSLTANLSGAARFEVTVEVTAVDPRGSAAAEDVTQSGTTLTFAAGSTTPTGTVQFTAVDNDVYDGGRNREYSVRWSKTGLVQTVGTTTEVLTITDDDEKPVLTLALTPTSIGENGGVSSLTGSLNGTLGSDVTVTVETLPRGVAVAGDLTQTGTTLTFAAGSTTPTETVQFTAVNDEVYSGDRQFSILTSVSGSVTVPTTSLRLTITDDEAMPTLTVELTPSSIGENGGVSSLTANLSGAARFEVTVEVTAVDPRGSAAAEDVTQSGTTLTFAAGSTTPTGTVQFTAVDNEVNDGNREYSIRWRKEGDVQTVGATTEVLTITDDDEKPVLTLELTSSSISENGGVSSLTGSLSGTLDSDVTVQVETIPRGVAVAADLTQTGTTLTFQAGSTTATGTVEFSAVNDDVYSGDRQFSILTSVSGSVTVPTTSLRLTITDDEAMPTLTVELTPSSIGENGGVSSLTANLSGAARFEVTVEVTEVDPRGSAAAEDVTQTGTTLTFAAGSTTPTGTVQFTAVDNDVYDGGRNREYSVRWSKTGLVQTVGTTTEVLTITDDDEKPVLTLALTPTSIGENGGVSSLTGSLNGTLGSDVTVTVETLPRGVAVAGDLTQTGTTLTFAAGSTTPTETVQFTAVNDEVYSGDRQFSILTSVSGSVTVPTTSLRLTITDDEMSGIVLSKLSLGVGEGADASYTVKLSAEPSGDVTVGIEGAAGTDLTLDRSSLTFTPSTWSTAQTVTVSAGQDADAADDEATLTHTAGSDYGSASKDLDVTVVDDETAGIVLSESSLEIGEGADASYTVKLSAEPSGDVTVGIEGAAGTDLTLDRSSLTFTPSTWSTAQTVTVSAGQDADAADDEATLTHTASGGGYGSASKDLDVTVVDDETAGIVLSESSLEIGEGADASYTVKLSAEPSGDVTVGIEGAAGTDLTLDRSSLTFTPSTWSTAQTVTVSAGQDADAADDEATLTHTASGGGYGSASKDLDVTVVDDETAGIVLSESSLEIGEGADASYTVKLSAEPSGDVTVGIEGAAGTDLTLDRSSLTFTPSTWSTAQTVTVSAGQDADAADDEATLTHTASGGGYGSASKDLDVTVVDDETAGIVLSESSLEIGEGADASYTVKLSAEPSGDVTVGIEGAAGTDLTLDRSSLTFTPSTWSTAQTVTVSAGQDADAADDEATLTHTASGGGYGSASKDLDVTVVDDETAGIVLSESSLEIGEGADASYTVKLSAEPSGDVTVGIEGAAGTDLTLDRSSLTFTPSTWSTAQTVTVSAGQDADAADDEATLTHTASGGGYGSASKDLDVTVVDDETAGIVLSESSLEIGEGADASYTVKLSAEPSGDVTVGIEGAAGTDLTLDRSSLTFTPSTWSTAQTVTVSAGQDADAADDEATLTHTASGGGYGSASKDLDVTVVDDETAGIVLSESSLEIGEGADASYTVKLSAEPSGDVTVGIEGAAGTDLTLDRSSLTFTPSTWSTAQTVTVSAGQDADAADDEATLTHTASGGGYGSASKDLDVTVVDDETAGIVLSESSLEIGEGADASYTVKLSAEPSGDVTVGIEGAAGTDLTLDRSSLTFTPSTWSTAQTVTVSAGQDADAADDEATLTHTAGSDYGSASKDLDVTVVDDETASKAPKAVDDATEVLEDQPSLIDVLANDWDPDGNRIWIVSVAAPAHGTAEIVSDRVRYSPHLHYLGKDGFTYTIADSAGLTAAATVTVAVLPVNHGPRGIGVIPDQLIEEGGAPVTVDLTSYFTDADGDPLTYEAMSSDDTAVTVTVADATLTLSAVVTGTATVTVTARDDVEGQTAMQTFDVLVGDRLVQAVMTDTLAALGRGHLSSVRSTIGRRLETGGGETTRMMVAGHVLSLDAWGRMGVQQSHELLFRAAQSRQYLSATHLLGSSEDPWLARSGASGLMGGGIDGGRLLQGTDVLLSFGGQDDERSKAGAGGPRWTVWGQGDLQTFQGAETEREGYDGNLRTGYLGLDARLGKKWLLGAAVARSGGRGGWQVGSSSGRLTTALTVVHPYLRWGDRNTSLWALGGIGRGTAENVRTLTGRRGTSPLSLSLGLVEGRRRLATTGRGLTLDLRGEASWARLGTGDGEETIDGLETSVRRVRTGVEVTLPLEGPGGLQLAPFGAVSSRHDGGAGQTGVGLEVAGGVRLTGGRVNIEAQWRTLALHTATDYEERGVSVTASLGAGQYEPGLTASVRPRWGAPGYGAESLWQDQFERYTYGEDRDDAAVDARVGYGLRLPGGLLLTPFGGYGQMGTGRRVQGGANLGIPGLSAADLAGPMQIEFMGERYSRWEGVEYRFTLFGIVNLGSAQK